MESVARRPRTTKRERFPLRRAAFHALALGGIVGLSLLVSACGGHSSGANVAQISSTSSTTTSTEVTGKSKLEAMVAFSACMRKHGVATFPDPDASGGIAFPRDSSPQFKAADRTCQKLLPNGGELTQQEQASNLRKMLAYAGCMREHGVPKFPDPFVAADGVPDFPDIGPSTGVNLSSPQVKAAQKACHTLLPGSPSGTGQGRS
jgi:hypothetical protein